MPTEFSRSGAFQIANGRGTVSYEKWVPHGKQYRAKAIELLTPEQKDTLNKLEGNELMSLPRDYQRAETKALEDAGYANIQDRMNLQPALFPGRV